MHPARINAPAIAAQSAAALRLVIEGTVGVGRYGRCSCERGGDEDIPRIDQLENPRTTYVVAQLVVEDGRIQVVMRSGIGLDQVVQEGARLVLVTEKIALATLLAAKQTLCTR